MIKCIALLFGLLLASPAVSQQIVTTPSLGLPSASSAFTCTAAGVCTLASASTIATSLAIGGATIGTNALAVTGTVLFNNAVSITSGTGVGLTIQGGVSLAAGAVTVNGVSGAFVGQDIVSGSASRIGFASSSFGSTLDTFLVRAAAATLQHGAADAAAPVAQTIKVQSVVAGTSNIAGVNWTMQGSTSTGSGTAGDIILQTGGTGAGATSQNAYVTAITIKGATQEVRLPQIASDAALTDTTVCQDTTNHGLRAGSGTAGICLGNVSTVRAKDNWRELDASALDKIMALRPGTWNYKAEYGDPSKLNYGFLAEDYAAVLPVLSRFDAEGRPNGVDMMGLVPILTRAIQQIKADNDNLRDEIRQLRRMGK